MDLRPILAIATICLTLLHFGVSRAAEVKKKQGAMRSNLPAGRRQAPRLTAIHKRLISKMRVSRGVLKVALGRHGHAARERQELSATTPGAYFVSRAFIRYNGPADWSLDDAETVGRFFLEHFGHPMPISAMGQTPTHDRMGLDHREALDVAVRPDSLEGRGLIAYLRQAGIPFMAFRCKIRGMATGAHIHIGRPSLRILHVKAISNPPSPAEQEDAQG